MADNRNTLRAMVQVGSDVLLSIGLLRCSSSPKWFR